RLVAMMKGRIWGESEPGKGSTFHFTADFDLQEERHPAQGALQAAELPPRAQVPAPAGPSFVLLVGDNPVNSKLAQRILEKAGYRVTAADSGTAALSALERDRFDLVLMDVQMPGMDGIETTARIREREKGTGDHVAILALTAHAMPGDRARCLAAGMDE